ncbi:hypothetical protein C1H46_009448 [Malus baccata]|uniref:Uncharacterized protein n=1 Tax=Malus baccata TaxID=106549 RepID=A0A540N1N8_MALBA|nr:hypothetical protein C1H46_009448 [Malus baccata]
MSQPIPDPASNNGLPKLQNRRPKLHTYPWNLLQTVPKNCHRLLLQCLPPMMTLHLSKWPPVFFSPEPSLSSSFAPCDAAPSVLKNWSSGVKKSLKDEALDSLKALSTGSVEAKGPPSPVQALLGGISAGVIALILYKFTTTIEASLNRQTISDNFSPVYSESTGNRTVGLRIQVNTKGAVKFLDWAMTGDIILNLNHEMFLLFVCYVRQITITIRTIINGLCYLATFVFGINAVGLVLYAGQLAINSIMEDTNEKTQTQGKDQSGSFNSKVESPANSGENSDRDDQSSDGTQ